MGVYFNGLPIGTINNNEFNPHQSILPNGDKKVITLNDLKGPFPFKNIDELKSYLIEVINSIKLGEIPKIETPV